jgi:hypothetical protein
MRGQVDFGLGSGLGTVGSRPPAHYCARPAGLPVGCAACEAITRGSIIVESNPQEEGASPRGFDGAQVSSLVDTNFSLEQGSNADLEQGGVGGQPSRSFEEANLSVEQGKNRCIILL